MFDTLREMNDFIENGRCDDADQHFALSPEQRSIGTDHQHWFEIVDIPTHQYRFGEVLSRKALAQMRGSLPGTTVERTDSVWAAHYARIGNRLFSKVWSRLNMDGQFVMMHRAHIWPISNATFETIRSADWDVRNLSGGAGGAQAKADLTAIMQRWREHLHSHDGDSTRPYEEFSDEVRRVARQATEEHRGEAVLGLIPVQRYGDKAVLVRLTTYELAQAAERALRDEGFPAKIAGENAVQVTDRGL